MPGRRPTWGQLRRFCDRQGFRYDIPPIPEPSQLLPDYLVRLLRDDRHWPEEQIASATREAAQRLLNDWYSREQSP